MTRRGYAAIGVYMPKFEANVGGLMRAAHCYGAQMVMVAGARYRRMSQDTTKAYLSIPLLHVPDFKLVPMNCTKVAVEFLEEGIPLPDFRHPERAFYLFGPEDGSIPEELLGGCKHRVYIPTKQCMNLAATANVVLYDRMAKTLTKKPQEVWV